MKDKKSKDEEPTITRMDLNEFVHLGLLQEINRQLLHPMGLALEVICEENGDVISFGGVWDYRDDPEGMRYAAFTEESVRKFNTVKEMFESKKDKREKALGYHIQPVEE